MRDPIDIAVVGATGLVGETFLQLIEKRKFPAGRIRLFASDRSEGQTRKVLGQTWTIESLKQGCFDGLKLVFFSSGDDISKEWAPEAVQSGAYAVDNSAASRMDPNTPLIVPEVNAHRIPARPGLIANPNCSTIQMVVALNAFKSFGLESVKVASYQAASGAGKAAQMELWAQQLQSELPAPLSTTLKSEQFPVPLAFNCIPQIGSFDADGFSSEEVKIRKETKKILEIDSLPVSVFTVRVPAWNAHSEAVWVRVKEQVNREQVLKAFKAQDGVVLDESLKTYPHARMASGADPVFVGRVRQDPEDPQTWMMWIVADNLLKGAALNGIQIAERIFDI